MVEKELRSPLTRRKKVKLLLNGEEKFPEVLEALRNAKHHIHMSITSTSRMRSEEQIEELLILKRTKACKCVLFTMILEVRTIKKKTEERMRKAVLEIYPFQKVHFYLLANRLNYRNHRKIISNRRANWFYRRNKC
jgi:cardiolipin synthase